MNADNAEYETIGHESTSIFDEASPRISLKSKFSVVAQEMLRFEVRFTIYNNDIKSQQFGQKRKLLEIYFIYIYFDSYKICKLFSSIASY